MAPDVSDLVDLAFFGWIGVVIALPFALLWPFCVMTKFLGARRVILIDVVTQRWDVSWLRGRSGSKRRINEIALGIAYGDRSGPVVI